jgi:hypothetical protein
MVESEIIQIRLKPDMKETLLSIQKFVGFDTLSSTVRQLIYTGINFYKTRKKKVSEIKEDVQAFTILPEEIYPKIRYKKKYLDWKGSFDIDEGKLVEK